MPAGLHTYLTLPAKVVLKIELFWRRARDDGDNIVTLLGTLIDDRLDGAEAVAD